MFNLSGSEMIFLLLIALVVLGPEKLPEAVRKFGKAYGEFKKMTTGFQSELRTALDEPMKEMRETADQLRKSANLDFNFEPDRVDGDTGQPATDTPVDNPAPISTSPTAPWLATSTAAPSPADPASAESSAAVAADVHSADVNATDVVLTDAPLATSGAAGPQPAPAPSGWSPVAPQPASAAAPAPAGWSPVSSSNGVGSNDDEVASE